jgi:hypothetical protein
MGNRRLSARNLKIRAANDDVKERMSKIFSELQNSSKTIVDELMGDAVISANGRMVGYILTGKK